MAAKNEQASSVAASHPDRGEIAPLAGLNQPGVTGPDAGSVQIDTTEGSLLHGIFGVTPRVPLLGALAELRVYLGCVLGTYGLLVVFALFSHQPLTLQPGSVKLPFLADSNVAFMFLVSLPVIVLLTLKDQQTLKGALNEVIKDCIVDVGPGDFGPLEERWSGYFRRINLGALGAGSVVGAIIAALNYIAYSPASVGFWIARDGHLLPVGLVFLGCIFVFYLCVCLYVARSIGIALFLHALVGRARIRMVPFHPDKCGGLRPVGTLGLRNQYLLSVVGLNVVLLVATSSKILHLEHMLYALVVAACVGYLVLGPIVFMAPLLSFRAGMLKTKTDLVREVAQRLRRELERIRGNLPNGPIADEDVKLVDRLRNISRTLEKLPVWPFDVNTLKKFLVAYVVPIASGATLIKIREIAEFIWNYLPSA